MLFNHFIYLLRYLFISVQAHGYLFIYLDYNPILSLLLKFFLIGSCATFNVPHLSLFLAHFKLCNTEVTRCCILILYFLCPNPGINQFSKDPPHSFYCRMYLQRKIWTLNVLLATEEMTDSSPFSEEN